MYDAYRSMYNGYLNNATSAVTINLENLATDLAQQFKYSPNDALIFIKIIVDGIADQELRLSLVDYCYIQIAAHHEELISSLEGRTRQLETEISQKLARLNKLKTELQIEEDKEDLIKALAEEDEGIPF